MMPAALCHASQLSIVLLYTIYVALAKGLSL